ncbi:MAG: DUF488 domain-containing protein [Planctomyces sp.]|nr:DUF488 domain-containing protein [Planctomyces sp.]
MLTRQKLMLAMLAAAGRPVNRVELTKWAFLLRQSSEEASTASFYDFVPYHSGPFSFSLCQEIEKLEEQGYVQGQGDSCWELGEVTIPTHLDQQLKYQAERVVRTHRDMPLESLLDNVYQQYPAFTVNSRRQKLAVRKTAPLAVYTSGYEGLSVDAFLNRLVTTGIRHLVDVRRNPVARRYGFHKSTLKRLCESLEIRYTHIPELGIESEKRQDLKTQADYDSLFRDYTATTLSRELDSIAQVATFVQEAPSVLVCMECQPSCCHRSHLAKQVAEQTGLKITHLV